MTPTQALNIHSLASRWATARVQRHKVVSGQPLSYMLTLRQAKARCRSAELALIRALDEVVEETEHPVHPDNASAHGAWASMVEELK